MVLNEMTGSLWAALCKRTIAHARAAAGLPPEEEKPKFMTGDELRRFVDQTGGRIAGVQGM